MSCSPWPPARCFSARCIPLFIDVLGKGKLSVGPPYFNTVFVAVMTPAMFLMGVGPIARWKKASLPELAVRLRWAFAASAVAAARHSSRWRPMETAGQSRIAARSLDCDDDGSQPVGDDEDGRRLAPAYFRLAASRPRSYYGMQLAHVGVAVSIVGVTIVTGYQAEKDLRMDVGDTVNVAGYDFRFRGVKE